MSAGQLFPLATQPGIKRDGTTFSQQYYIDGQWCRFQRGYPRKMGGYQQLIGYPNDETHSTPRGLFVVPDSSNFNTYIGDQYGLNYFTMDKDGNVFNPLNSLMSITPAGFVPQSDYNWQFDSMFSTTSESQLSTLTAPAKPFPATAPGKPRR